MEETKQEEEKNEIPFWIGKKYKQHTVENFDEYMKALGFNYFIRKLGHKAKSITYLNLKDDIWTLTIETTVTSQTINFKLDEEFDEDTMDGRKTKSIITLEGNALTHIQRAINKEKGDKDTTCIRKFEGDELFTTLICDGIVSTRVSKVME